MDIVKFCDAKNINFYFIHPFMYVYMISISPSLLFSFYVITQLDLILKSEDGGDISDFITNGEWFLIGKLMQTENMHI